MTPADEEEPVIRDNRKLDPTTGHVREPGDPVVDGVTDPAPAEESDPHGTEVNEPAEPDELAQLQSENLDLADQMARAKADLYNLDQRFNTYVQRAKAEASEARQRGREDVVEALITVLDEVDLARQHDELHGPFASISEKLETTLAQGYGLERFGAAGEGFDPNLHEALMHSTSDEQSSDVIDVVMQPGYRLGDKVVRPARVGVIGPA